MALAGVSKHSHFLPLSVDASVSAALVSEAAISTAPAIAVRAGPVVVPPAALANVAVPATVAPSDYLSMLRRTTHKAAHWNVPPNRKFK